MLAIDKHYILLNSCTLFVKYKKVNENFDLFLQ